TGTGGDVQVGRDLLGLLNLADKEAMRRGDQYIATEMFLLALADDKGDAGRIAREAGPARPARPAGGAGGGRGPGGAPAGGRGARADDKGDAGRVAREAGLDRKALEAAIEAVRGGHGVDSPEAEEQREALKKYTTDLTERAREGKLDPVIGRDDEIRRTIQILQRRTKNNPVLIGDPGLGKTGIVEGLAQRIV